MKFTHQIGKSFENVSQRLLYNYIATHPYHRGVDSDAATAISQKQMYDFILGIFTALYDDPTLIGMTTDPDETEDRPYQHRVYKDGRSRHLDARKLRRKNERKIESLFDSLQLMGELGAVTGNRMVVPKVVLPLTQRKLNMLIKHLSNLGLQLQVDDEQVSVWSERYPAMCAGWKLLSTLAADESAAYDAAHRQELDKYLGPYGQSTVPKWRGTVYFRYLDQIKNRIFKRAMFDPGYDYAVEVLRDLVNAPEAYERFVDSLVAQGFRQQFDWGSGLDITNFINLSLSKHYTSPTHDESFTIGPKIRYESRHHHQLTYIFMDDKDAFSALHRHFAHLPEGLQDLVYEYTGECTACGYCNQVNRNLPFKSIPVVYKNAKIELCHIFKSIHSKLLSQDIIDEVSDLYAWIDAHFVAVE